MDQEDTKPSHIKEEQEELWISQDGEQPQGQEEADIKFSFTPVMVKSEDDEEIPQSSQLHQVKAEQMETGADGEDSKGSEQARSSDSEQRLHPEIEVMVEELSEAEAEDCNNVKCTKMYQSDLNSLERMKDQKPKTEKNVNSCGHSSKKSNQTGHMEIQTTENHLDFSKCGERFSVQAHVVQHMEIHKVDRPSSCPECGKTYGHKSHLMDHLRSHTEEKPFSCSVCGKRYKYKSTLTHHLKTHTGEKLFSCPECGKSYPRKYKLTEHLRIHTGNKPFSCSECGKEFIRKENLTQHMLVHTREKPFSCTECGKKFNLKGGLRQHMRIHMAEKPFSCSECDKAFIRKEYLMNHMIVHTKERPFGCSECTKSFKYKETLITHMRVHTGEKPFSCSSCEQRFTWHGQLRKHKCLGGDVSEPFNNLTKLKRQTEMKADVEGCRGSEGGRNSDTEGHVQPEIEVIIGEYSEPEPEDFIDDS
ncbi:gastrula zinc finger protein XlCGF57.1-like isoform X2 [Cheilinus undulatus]|nr:gastrula zinc finger protein XlCGF57.1-like isoform X2 [Cheilinus undulatus]